MRKRVFFPYCVCVMFFFMWQTAIALAFGTVPALAGVLYMALGVHYLTAGLALVLLGLICDKAIRAQRARRLFGAVLAALGGLATLCLIFIGDMRLFIAVFFVATVFGFGANGVLTGGLFIHIRQVYKPMAVGLPFAVTTLLRIPVDLSVRDGAATYRAMLVFCAAGLFLLALALLAKPVRRAFEAADAQEAPAQEPMDAGKNGRLVRIAVACGALVYVMFGIAESFMTASNSVVESILILRLVQIAACLAVGVICLHFGYYASVIASISFLGLATLAHLFSWSGAVGVAGSLATGVGFLLFTVPLRSIFAEVAKRGRYPCTLSAFGYGLYFLMQIIGFPLAALIKEMPKDFGMAVHFVLFVFTAPLVVLLFYYLRSSYAVRLPLPAGAGEWPAEAGGAAALPALTRREKEILSLVLQGQLSREIAEALFVSESTVNWHVGNILKKTGVESRAKLVAGYAGVEDG